MLPSVSGAQCARALRRAGFHVELHGPDHALVSRRGAFVVVVPLVEQLRREQLMVILRLCGLTREQFEEYLEEHE